MTSRILVTGGTGRLGRQLVPLLQATDCKLRVLRRTARAGTDGIEDVPGDLLTGAGLAAAVDGADIIIHCAGTTEQAEDHALTANLIRAAATARPSHLVKISVVGADRVPVASRADRAMFGYFASMLASEQAVASSGLPWTILRATQFYELAELVAKAMSRLPVVPVPGGIRFQPVDSRDVASRLAELALGPPAGLAPDVAGPRVYPMADLIRVYLRAARKRRALVRVRLPGAAAAAVRAGANLPRGGTTGHRTWEEYLAEHF
jgi:uncharacterized protein YbjT (DUF2867 family)